MSCLICGCTSFWCPAGDPLGSIRPEFGPWRCDVCEPRPIEAVAHSCGVPAGEALSAPATPWNSTMLADRSPLAVAVGSSLSNPDASKTPAWDDWASWAMQATKAGSLAARGAVARAWCLATGGHTFVEGGTTMLAVPVRRAELACLDMERIAGEAGMGVRFNEPAEEVQ